MCEKDSKSVTKGVTIGHNPESWQSGCCCCRFAVTACVSIKNAVTFCGLCPLCVSWARKGQASNPAYPHIPQHLLHTYILLHTFLVHSVFYRGGGGLSQRVDEGCCNAPRPPSSNMLLLVACLPPLAVVSTPRVLVCMIHW